MPFGIPKELSNEASENFAKKLEGLHSARSKKQSKNEDEIDVYEEENDKFKKKSYPKKYVIYNFKTLYQFYFETD